MGNMLGLAGQSVSGSYSAVPLELKVARGNVETEERLCSGKTLFLFFMGT